MTKRLNEAVNDEWAHATRNLAIAMKATEERDTARAEVERLKAEIERLAIELALRGTKETDRG